jgi:hypothetical protein
VKQNRKKGCLECLGIGAGVFVLLVIITSLLPKPPNQTVSAEPAAMKPKSAPNNQQQERPAKFLPESLRSTQDAAHANKVHAFTEPRRPIQEGSHQSRQIAIA